MPTRQSVSVTDRLLSGFALDYGNQELVTLSGSGFGNTADFMFPKIPHTVEGLDGRYYTYNFKNKLALGHSLLRKEGNYPRIKWDVSSATYTLEDYGASHEYDDRVAEAGFAPLNISQDAGDILTQRVLREYANQVITEATTSGNFNAGITNTVAATSSGGVWDTSSTDLISQVNTAKRVIHRNCGVMPDRIVTSMDVWTDGIMKNDAIQAGLQATQRSAGASDFENVKTIFSQFFGLDGAVDNTLYDNSNPTATITPTYLFPKSVLVFVSNARIQRVKAMRLGFTAVRGGEFLRGYKWNVEPHSNWRALSFQRAVKMVADEAGYLITGAVS